MDKEDTWNTIRQTFPSPFFEHVRADRLQKEILHCQPLFRNYDTLIPFTELESLHRELSKLDERLEVERGLLERDRTQVFEKRWEIASQRQRDLQEVVDKFGDYCQTAEVKMRQRENERQKIAQACQEEDRKIGSLKKELECLKGIKTRTEARQALCQRYQAFLEESLNQMKEKGVTSESGGVQDLLARFEELRRIRQRQTRHVVSNMTKLVETVALEDKEKARLSQEELAYRVHERNLDNYQDELLSHIGRLTERSIKAKVDVQEDILKAERQSMALYSLYSNVANEMKQQLRVKPSNVKGQLLFIKKCLCEMKSLDIRMKESLNMAGSDIPLVTVEEKAPQREIEVILRMSQSSDQSSQ